MRLTHRAHEAVGRVLSDGDLALDATAGNGHDTVFLAERVGEGGRVWAFDVQDAAIAQTRRRLEEAGFGDRVCLIHDTHANLASHLPEAARGRLGAVMFNLGYLPGSDRSLVTDAPSTLAALEASLEVIRPGGLVSLMVYRGHPGGREEWQQVKEWLSKSGASTAILGDQGMETESPVLVLISGHEAAGTDSSRGGCHS